MAAGGRMGGKVGYSSSSSSSGFSGINEEIVYVSIGMAALIFILLALALCYVAREQCQKRHQSREFYVTA